MDRTFRQKILNYPHYNMIDFERIGMASDFARNVIVKKDENYSDHEQFVLENYTWVIRFQSQRIFYRWASKHSYEGNETDGYVLYKHEQKGYVDPHIDPRGIYFLLRRFFENMLFDSCAELNNLLSTCFLCYEEPNTWILKTTDENIFKAYTYNKSSQVELESYLRPEDIIERSGRANLLNEGTMVNDLEEKRGQLQKEDTETAFKSLGHDLGYGPNMDDEFWVPTF